MVFVECFAGKGLLSKAMQRVGFHADAPQDSGDLKEGGFDLLFHFPPRARPSLQHGTVARGHDSVADQHLKVSTPLKLKPTRGTA